MKNIISAQSLVLEYLINVWIKYYVNRWTYVIRGMPLKLWCILDVSGICTKGMDDNIINFSCQFSCWLKLEQQLSDLLTGVCQTFWQCPVKEGIGSKYATGFKSGWKCWLAFNTQHVEIFFFLDRGTGVMVFFPFESHLQDQ